MDALWTSLEAIFKHIPPTAELHPGQTPGLPALARHTPPNHPEGETVIVHPESSIPCHARAPRRLRLENRCGAGSWKVRRRIVPQIHKSSLDGATT